MNILAKLLIVVGCLILVGCGNENIETLDPYNQPNVSEETGENQANEEIIDENKEAINVYLFWGDGCHICENLMAYFDTLEEEYGNYYNLVKYEVWYNEENNNLMHEVGNKLNQTYFAVPFLVIGDEVIVGYNNSKDNYIKEKIIEEYNNGEYIDVVEQIKSSLN